MEIEKFKQALQADFNALYQKEYTADWKEQRLVRNIEIGIMEFKNVKNYIKEGVKWQM